MIAFVKGMVAAVTEETVIVDVNGIGYELYCSGTALRSAQIGERISLHTYLQVKEDGVTLFGFADNKEKELFLKIISVSGIGPKNGIAILTGISADAFAECILTADVKRLSAVKGLGKKKAEKLVLELHGKISAAEVISAGGEDSWEGVAKSAPVSKISAEEEEAISALMGLGFTRSESTQAIARAKEQGATTVEDIIRKALQGSM